MKALVFNQYMNALGGGERYTLGLARALSEQYEVDVAGPVKIEEAELAKLGFQPPGPMRRLPIRQFTRVSGSYDLAVQVTNYFPLRSRAPASIVMVQFPYGPFNWKHPLHHLRNRPRGKDVFITNSEYSRSWCGPRWGVDATVVAPPVDLNPDRPTVGPKRDRIIAVGRFFKGFHAKRFDVLVEAFSLLPADVRDRWELVLVGGTRHSSSPEVLRELRAMSRGLNVRIEPDASQQQLRDLYRGSSLYWQATGYGRSPGRPEYAEHFGIALVEALSYGCVPVAYRDGGAPEILGSLGTSCLWTEMDQLVRMTANLIADDSLRPKLSARAVELAEPYSYQAFEKMVTDLVRSRILV